MFRISDERLWTRQKLHPAQVALHQSKVANCHVGAFWSDRGQTGKISLGLKDQEVRLFKLIAKHLCIWQDLAQGLQVSRERLYSPKYLKLREVMLSINGARPRGFGQRAHHKW